MKTLILLAFHFLIASSAMANETCDKFNNTIWQTDEFNASVEAGFFGCAYKGTVAFHTEGDELIASLDFKLLSQGGCPAILKEDLRGKCLDSSNGRIYPLYNSDQTIWLNRWGTNQPDRYSFDGEMHLGHLGGYFSMYLVPLDHVFPEPLRKHSEF